MHRSGLKISARQLAFIEWKFSEVRVEHIPPVLHLPSLNVHSLNAGWRVEILNPDLYFVGLALHLHLLAAELWQTDNTRAP